MLPNILSRMPIRIGNMPFNPDEEIDFGARYSEPMAKQDFDALIDQIFSKRTSDDIRWDFFTQSESEHAARNRCNKRKMARHLAIMFEGLLSSYDLWDDNCRSMLKNTKWRKCDLDRRSSVFDVYDERDLEEPKFEIHFTKDVSGISIPETIDQAPELLPHVACIMSIDGDFDGTILRPELLRIAQCMVQRMDFVAWKHHSIFPVFIYTFSHNQIRITQGYYDGKIMQIRQTKPINLFDKPGDLETIKILMRWVLSRPIGHTRWPTEEEDEQVSSSVSGLQSPSSKRGLRMRA
jgi:hypothetical protein